MAMDVISSSETTRSKWGVSIVGTSLWVLGLLDMLGKPEGRVPTVALAAWVIALPLGGFICSRIVWTIADEVIDLGSCLSVRRGAAIERIDFAGIMKVVGSQDMLPSVNLYLRTPSTFGYVIRFLPRNNAADDVAAYLEQRMLEEREKRLQAFIEKSNEAVDPS